MLERVRKIRNLLETEKSNSKRFLLSNLYITYFNQLSYEDRLEEEDFANSVSLILAKYDFYDFLKNDGDIYKDFFDKVSLRYEKNDFNNYNLFPDNKLKLDEARVVINDLLSTAFDFSDVDFSKFYNFDKIQYVDMNDNVNGFCINTFGFDDSNIYLNKDTDKFVIFIRDLFHEIGHNYENVFMYSMSSFQQVDRYAYCFKEVMSSFFEAIAMDYMIENRIYLDDAHRILNLYYSDFFDIMESLKIFTDPSKVNLDNCIYDDENLFYNSPEGFLCSYNYSNDIIYGYGALLGEYFFDIYKKDKKEGFRRLCDFLSNQALYDERGMLDSVNFKENDFSFLDNGINKNMQYMRKKYKW